jgi:hypothetical protein
VNRSVEIGDRLLSLGEGNVSRHLDELIANIPHVPNYGEWCFVLFSEVVEYLRTAGERRTIIWIIPVSISKKICSGERIGLDDVESEFGPSTVYLFCGNQIFNETSEEYRRMISVPQLNRPIKAMFRSWRDARSAEFNWEFNNDIYLWSIFDGDKIFPVK